MNGIISESASRSSVSRPKILTSIILGGCLFSGFVSGMSISPTSISHLNPFRTETLHFAKISWISAEKQHEFKLATIDTEATPSELRVTADLAFVPYEFKPEKMRRYRFNFSQHKHVNFLKLEQAVAAVKEATRYDAFSDYQNASTRLRGDFALAMNSTKIQTPGEMIAMTSSSAEIVKGGVPVANPARVRDDVEPVETTPAGELSPADLLSIEAEKSSQPDPESAKAVVAVHRNRKTHATVLAPVVEESISTVASSSEEPVRQKIDELPGKSLNTQALSSQTKKGPYALSTEEDEAMVTTSTELSTEQQRKLTDELLAVQINTAKQNSNQIAKVVQRETINTREKLAEAANQPDPDPMYDPADYESPQSKVQAKSELATCATLDNHEFVRPNGPSHPTLDTQICPSKVTWISKTRSNTGWVKVEGDDYLPTLTLHPAPNQGPTLLIDQNGLALIALKSGVHVTKGMGLIIGSVPDGYKVNYEGRAEETEYFESSGKNYFAILNAEPGAGVVSVESKTNPNLSSMVFTPVLDDTISYLDLTAPLAQNLNIKVVKSGAENDPEVAKLTVGLSTQQGIQAITRADGQASLRNVYLVPGFQVFVDVSSHTEDATSYTYRYELKRPRRSGTYVVNQISEKSIHHWLDQVKQGLSDQSAMVVGMYDRKKLDGFRNPHFTQVNPLTAKYGLEPINYTVLWNGKLSMQDPLEGDVPRFMSVQIPEGLSQVNLLNEAKQVVSSELIPVSPRVIHVISE